MVQKNTSNVTWRLLDYSRDSGAWQMAADLYFYREIDRHPEPIIVRFYSFVPPTITIGHHQTVERAVKIEACAAAGIDIVRRPTGGRALLHRHEINYAVIADTTRAAVFGSGLAEAFFLISRAVAGGLERLGVPVEISGGRREPPQGSSAIGGGLCASSTTRYEITSGGVKIVAAAQLRGSGKLLQHGMIYIDEQSITPSELFVQSKRLVSPIMTDLRSILGQAPAIETILREMKQGFKDTFGSDCLETSCRTAERESIAGLLPAE